MKANAWGDYYPRVRPPTKSESVTRWTRVTAWARVRRPHLVVISVLVLLAFVQRPGQTTFDTKLDLTEDPFGFLDRALSLWNPDGSFGELQNQAYGYLFPIGPFFAIGHAVGLPGWITQRIWTALLLALAYAGVVAVCRALPVGNRWSRIVAGLAYALSPRILTTIGPISAETLIVSLLPWAILPLLHWQRLGLRRAAALSAAGVLLMGAANATLVVAVLPLLGLVVLAQPSGVRARLAAWWAASIGLACAWWVGALLVFGTYSTPFLNHVESAVNTTGGIGLAEAVRGATHWVAWVAVGADPWWPSAYVAATKPVLILAGTVIGTVGLLALLDRRVPLRSAFLVSAILGVVVLTVGSIDPLESPLAATWHNLLDGPLNPFRNVHKFDPLVRLPVAIGLAHVVGRVLGPKFSADLRSVARGALAVGVAVCVVVPATVALSPGLRPGPGWDKVPSWWAEAADFVAERDPAARTLVLPSTGFGTQVWGRTVDEPIQPLAGAPWVSRNQVFLGSEGAARWVEGLDAWIESGRGSPALGDILARAGVRFVIVRGDLEPRRSGTPLASVVRQALERSGGIRRVAQFGPSLTGGAVTGLRVLGYGLDAGVPAIEVYEVERTVAPARVAALDDLVEVTGGPESIPRLIEDRLLPADVPAVLGTDRVDGAALRLLTDDLPRRERNFGRVRDNRGPVLAADEPTRFTRARHDIVPSGADEYLATARYIGVARVSASSSRGYADSLLPTDLALAPWSALDGDPFTAWRSDTRDGPVGQWIQVDLTAPVALGSATVRFVDSRLIGSQVTAVDVHTEGGVRRNRVAGDGSPETLELAPRPTRYIRLEIVETAGGSQGQAGVAEIELADVEAGRVVATAQVADGGTPSIAPAGISLHRYEATRNACMVVDFSIRCDPNLVRRGDEPVLLARSFATPESARYRVSGTVLPRPSSAAHRLLEPLSGITASASSTRGGDAAAAPQWAVDGNPSTSWVAGSFDLNPVIELVLPEEREVAAIRLTTAQHPVVARPTSVTVAAGEAQWDRDVIDGWVMIPRTRTNQLRIRITDWTTVLSTDPAGTGTTRVSPGIAEIEIPGLEDLIVPPDLDAPTGRPCGFGPDAVIDGVPIPTTVVGTVRDVLEGRPMRWNACGDHAGGITLRRGQHVIEVHADEMFAADSVLLDQPGAWSRVPGKAGVAHVSGWDRTRRTVEVTTDDEALLIVPESANDGWVARFDGQVLPAARVDGWQQAWLLPADASGTVELEFAPQRTFMAALGGGAVAAVVLLGIAVVPTRSCHRLLGIEARPRRFPRLLRRVATWIAATVIGGVLAGVLGAVAFAVAVVTQAVSRRIAPVAALAGLAAIAGVGASLLVGRDYADAIRAGSVLPLIALVGVGAIRAVTGDTGGRIAARPWWRVRPWIIAAFGLVVVQLAIRAYGLSGGYFWQDDFIYLRDASQGLSLDYLARDHDGHLMPGQFLLVWVIQQVAPMHWGFAAGVLLVLQLAASLLVLRLLRSLAGDGPLTFVLFAVYALSPLIFTATLWWASALQALPLQIFMAWALLTHLRYLRTGSRRWALWAVAALLAGMLFWQKGILIALVLIGFTIVVAPVVVERRARDILRESAPVLATYAGLAVAYAGLWLLNGPFDSAQPQEFTDLWQLTRYAVLDTFLPGLLGAMFGDAPTAALLAPAPLVSVVVGCVLILGAGVVLAVRSAGRTALLPLVLAAAYLFVNVALIATARVDFVGTIIGRDPRYTADAVLVAVVSMAGVGVAVSKRWQQLPPEMWRLRGLIAGVAVLVIGAAAAVSAAGVVSHLPMAGSREYVEGSRDAAQRLGGIEAVDSQVPEEVMSSAFLDAAKASVVFAGAPEPLRFYEPTADLRILDAAGLPLPVAIRGYVGSLPIAEGHGCPRPVRSGDRTITLDGELSEGQWIVQVSYFAGHPTSGQLRVGEHLVAVDFLAGTHDLYVELPGIAVPGEVTIGGLPSGDAVCVTGVLVGTS